MEEPDAAGACRHLTAGAANGEGEGEAGGDDRPLRRRSCDGWRWATREIRELICWRGGGSGQFLGAESCGELRTAACLTDLLVALSGGFGAGVRGGQWAGSSALLSEVNTGADGGAGNARSGCRHRLLLSGEAAVHALAMAMKPPPSSSGLSPTEQHGSRRRPAGQSWLGAPSAAV